VPPEDVIIIHVRDEGRRVNRDFYCSRELLLEHMHYFASYLADDRRHEDVDISVHCDVHIFEWLMEYIHQPSAPPLLDPSSVVSILISADFLQMPDLVQLCLAYFKQNASDVLRLPIDLSCLNDELLSELAKLFQPDELEKVRDKKDKLVSRLYDAKIEAQLAPDTAVLHRCTYCHKLFADGQREWETCPKAPVMIDFHGNAIAEHVADRAWDMRRWVAATRRAKQYSARDLYWKIWSLVHFLTCSVCGQPFPLAELEHCTYHPQQPTFANGDNCGTYPCCGQPALRFDLSAGRRRLGCCAKRHTPDLRGRLLAGGAESCQRKWLLETALAHADLVLTPFEPSSPGNPPAEQSGVGQSGASSESDEEPFALKPPTEASDADSDSRVTSDDDSDADSVSDSGGSSSAASQSDDDSHEPADTPGGAAAAFGSTDAPGLANPTPGLAAGTPGSMAALPSALAAASSLASRAEVARTAGGRPRAGSEARRGAGRARGAAAHAKKGSGAWRVDSQQHEDQQRLTRLCWALEAQRQDAGPVCKDVPHGDRAPTLSERKAFFLDRRFIMQLSRSGAVSVVWPRSSATAVGKREPFVASR